MSYNNYEHLIGQLESAGYRLDVLGEAVSVEGREVRQCASELRSRLATSDPEQGFEPAAAYEAAVLKLQGTVETEIRHQLEVIRDVIRSL